MLHQQIKDEIKEAMKAKDAVKLSVVRGLVTAFTNELVAKGKKPDEMLTDEEALAVIKRGSKQRQDSIAQFKAGGREDLVAGEEAELKIIETYLPAQMSREEIEKIAKAKIAELTKTATSGSSGDSSESLRNADKSKLGVLVGAVMKEAKGTADGNLVKAVLEELLG